MDITKFNEKFNRIDGNIYTIEEVITLVNGVYEAPLIHDNVELKTINIYTGSKLTGTKITTYSTSTPSLTPWKTVIKIFSNLDKLYITYETTGDQVEAEDINNLQDAINLTQEELNKETNRATSRENNIEKNLNSEIERAKASEKNISDNLGNEITRSKNKENELLNNIENETKRASATESKINADLNTEINRAKNAESTETTRATNRENAIENNLNDEISRAKNSEKVLKDNLDAEVNRAKTSEKTISDNLANEVNRSTNAEKLLTDNLNTEINRSKSAEKTLTENLNSEINRAKSVESDITSKLNEEVNRAKTRENSIESNLNNYKTSNDSEIQGLKAKDIDLDNKKANLDYVNLELNKRYTKDQTFTREEVLKKIQDLIGTAPDTLDTFKEIADALGNDPNFATTIMNELSSKVDKVTGKSLSTNDYDNTEKSKLADVNAKKHEHSNKSIIDKITQGLLDAWNNAYSHISDSIRHITSSERNLWNTVSDKANKTDIPSKLSQLTNDKKFITQSDIDTSQNHIHNNKPILDKINQQTLDDINLSADKVLKNESTPIKTDSTLTKLSDCEGGYVRNMQIKGKTLQNLWNGGNVNYLSSENRLIETTMLDLYKTNTDYTIINYNNKKIKLGIFTKVNTYSRSIEVLPNSKFIIRLNDEIIKDKVGEEVNGWANSDNDKNELKKSIVILEGEVKEIPPYFEGIKSVGEAEGNKISILSTGKNLFNSNDKFTLTGVGDGTKEYIKIYNFYAYLEKGKQYVFTCKTDGVWGGIEGTDTVEVSLLKDGKYNSFKIIQSDNVTFICNETGKYYLRLDINKNNTTHSFWDIQIEEGTIVTTYEEYKEDKTEILTGTEPLRGLPSGISDVINYENNEITRNVGKIVLNGNESWAKQGQEFENTALFSILFLVANTAWHPFNNLICDNFINGDTWSFDKEAVSIDNAKGLNFRILKSKLLPYGFINGNVGTYVPSLKKWLQANPTTFYYQLANPKTEKLNIKDTLQSFENGYIQLDNTITPTAQLEYSMNLPSIISGVVEIQDKLIDRVNILEKKKSITWDELEGV